MPDVRVQTTMFRPIPRRHVRHDALRRGRVESVSPRTVMLAMHGIDGGTALESKRAEKIRFPFAD